MINKSRHSQFRSMTKTLSNTKRGRRGRGLYSLWSTIEALHHHFMMAGSHQRRHNNSLFPQGKLTLCHVNQISPDLIVPASCHGCCHVMVPSLYIGRFHQKDGTTSFSQSMYKIQLVQNLTRLSCKTL